MFAAKIFFLSFFLFLSVMCSAINIARFVRGQEVTFVNFFLQAVGITGFVTIQWLL